MSSTPSPAVVSPLLTPFELAELREKAVRGLLTPEDTRRFIESTRASFLSQKIAPTPKAPKGAQALPKAFDVDFF